VDSQATAEGKGIIAMIGFIVLFVVAFAGAILFFVVQKKPMKEATVFAVLSLLSFMIWIDIMLEHTFNPNKLVGFMLDWMGL
jgi:drug/metabolite transporter (DMT)-like permease